LPCRLLRLKLDAYFGKRAAAQISLLAARQA
jgi:hypothetical protein